MILRFSQELDFMTNGVNFNFENMNICFAFIWTSCIPTWAYRRIFPISIKGPWLKDQSTFEDIQGFDVADKLKYPFRLAEGRHNRLRLRLFHAQSK